MKGRQGKRAAPRPKTRTSTKFQPGESGNPKGRPRGSRNRATLAAEQLLDGDADAIIAKVIALAKRGDPVALRICIDRIVPRGRGRPIEVDLPELRKATDLVAAASAIVDAAARGEMTPAEAQEWMRVLDAQRRILETEELALRIELIEQQLEDGEKPKGRFGYETSDEG